MSDQVTVDLSNYKDRVGSRLTPGRYKVVVEDAEMDKSKAGNDMINVWFRVLDGMHEGATVIDRLTITEKALFRVVGFMQGIGMPTPKKRLSLSPRQFVGKVLEIDVEDGEPYNGRVKSEVRGYIKVAAAPPVDLEEGGTEPAPEPVATAEPVDLDTLNLG